MRPVRGAAPSSVAPPEALDATSNAVEADTARGRVDADRSPLAAERRRRRRTGRAPPCPRTSARYPRSASVRREHRGERLVRLVGAGHDEQPRRSRVEPVHDPRAAAAPPRARAAPPSRAAGSRPCRSPWFSVGCVGTPGGLDHHEEVRRRDSGPRAAAPRGRAPATVRGRPRRARRPRRRNDFGRATPSTLTPPPAIARCASARGIAEDAPPPRRRAGPASRPRIGNAAPRGDSPSGGVPGPARGVLAVTIASSERPDHDRAVGQVEDRPDPQVDEVRHVPRDARTVERAVGQVAERSPEDQPERDGDAEPRQARREATTMTTETTIVAPANIHGALRPEPERAAGVRRVVNDRTPGITSTGPGRRGWPRPTPWSARSSRVGDGRDREQPRGDLARPPRPRRLPPRLRLRVLDAEVHVRQRLQAGLLDRLAAPRADPVGPLVDAARARARSSPAGPGRCSRSTGRVRARR